MMSLSENYLRKKYLKLFNNNKYQYNFIITDLKFAFKEISKILKKNNYQNILEIGSGTGILLNELQILYPKKNFSGIDPGESGFHNYKKIFSRISRMNKKVKLYKKNINSFNIKKKFDLIFSFNVFEHIKNQKIYLKKTYSMINKNGKIIIYAPNYNFPYEPHFVIPIIFNKKVTEKIFQKKIKSHELKTNEKGLWEGLNLSNKTKIEKILIKNKFDYHFDKGIKNIMIKRIFEDKFFFKRQGFAAKLAKFANKFYLDKIVFDFFKVPFPYFKLIINKEK